MRKIDKGPEPQEWKAYRNMGKPSYNTIQGRRASGISAVLQYGVFHAQEEACCRNVEIKEV